MVMRMQIVACKGKLCSLSLRGAQNKRHPIAVKTSSPSSGSPHLQYKAQLFSIPPPPLSSQTSLFMYYLHNRGIYIYEVAPRASTWSYFYFIGNLISKWKAITVGRSFCRRIKAKKKERKRAKNKHYRNHKRFVVTWKHTYWRVWTCIDFKSKAF